MADLRLHARSLAYARLLIIDGPLWYEGKLLNAPILAIDLVI